MTVARRDRLGDRGILHANSVGFLRVVALSQTFVSLAFVGVAGT